MYNSFAKSKAVSTGILTDLSDCELFIDGISHDKISDITINIIRRMLVEFTKDQCRRWAMPMERKPTGPYWHDETKEWRNSFDLLPIYNGYPLILVPKEAVRYRLAVDDREYYDFHVVEYIRQEIAEQENVDSWASLGRVLRGGRAHHEEVRQGETPFLQGVPPAVFGRAPRGVRGVQARRGARRGGQAAQAERQRHLRDGEQYRARPAHVLDRGSEHHDDEQHGPRRQLRRCRTGQPRARSGTSRCTSPRWTARRAFDAETKTLLKAAIDTIEAAEVKPDEKDDAKENLQKLTDELKQEKRPGVVQRCLNRLAEVVPAVATILSSGVMIVDIIGKAIH